MKLCAGTCEHCEQVIQAALLRVRDETREEAAIACDVISQKEWDAYKGRIPYGPDNPKRADPHTQGISCGADLCATAIRALGESEGGKLNNEPERG